MLLRIAIVLIGVGAVAGIASAIAWHYNDDHDRTVEYRLVNQDGTPVNQNGGSVVVVRGNALGSANVPACSSSQGSRAGEGAFELRPLTPQGATQIAAWRRLRLA